jgi:hypothetical protein
MVKEPLILEWTTVIKGDDPKRFKIEDVRAGKYNKVSWLQKLKRLVKRDA